MKKDHLRSIRIAEKVFAKLPQIVSVGKSETEIARDIRKNLKQLGAKKESFRVIVATGKNSAKVHGFAGNKEVKAGDVLMFDFGALASGLRSDITRTYVLGKPTAQQKKIYGLVKKAQSAAIKKVRAGVRACDVDLAARAVIRKAGYGKLFNHSTGHGVGKLIHEAPKIGPKNNNLLKEGMVITIEPGIYLRGEFGVRLEDMVEVTRRGCKMLTKLPKNLKLKC